MMKWRNKLNPINVLILDDDEKVTDRIAEYLAREPFKVFSAYTPNQAFSILNSNEIDIIIIDILLPEMNGIDVLSFVNKNYPDIEAIMISGHGDMDIVIKAMQKGAIDFLKKPFNSVDLQLAIERTSRYIKLHKRLNIEQNKNSLISCELEKLIDKKFIGTSKVIKDVLGLAVQVGRDSDINVLIVGENGTGKEIIARIIHYASNRKDKSFSAINSAAIPETLLESEFFGHRKGAFTDAKENKKGYFELANEGSIFLDEIADMPYSLQAKLLRAIEEKRIKPVGSDKEFTVDVRIISATNKELEKLIEEKKFRLDLYHRINNFIIIIPPLRDRIEDIEPLLYYFVEIYAMKKNRQIPKIHNEVIENLKNYSFPGNVRELRNMVERALILSKENVLDMSHFSFLYAKNEIKTTGKTNFNLKDNEVLLIKQALSKTKFNQQKAAGLLGISRDSLIRRMKKHKVLINKGLDDIEKV
jgi:DNA-binding NtrC family response regulator